MVGVTVPRGKALDVSGCNSRTGSKWQLEHPDITGTLPIPVEPERGASRKMADKLTQKSDFDS
jgi:hypothetical protein